MKPSSTPPSREPSGAKPTAEAASSGKEAPRKKARSNPEPAASPASVVSKAASPLPESAADPPPPPVARPDADTWPQPTFAVEQKVMAWVEEAQKWYTCWVEEIFFAKTAASEHRYRLAFPKHKAYRELKFRESKLYAHPDPGLLVQYSRPSPAS